MWTSTLFHIRPSNSSRRFGEKTNGLSEAEKFSHRLRMVRRKQNKRASKYSLDKETDLTHFGKRIADMDKSHLRDAYVGMEDETEDKPFSYDTLIANSKEERAEARRKKMEAEAELEDLDQSFGSVFTSLAHRDIEKDKMDASRMQGGEDDLAFIARSFQMENIQRAPATDRSQTDFELKTIRATAEKASSSIKASIADENVFDEDDVIQGDVIVESDDDVPTPEVVTATPSTDPSFIQLVRSLMSRPSLEISLQDQESLIEYAHSIPSSVIDEFFKTELFDREEKSLVLIKIASIIFPLGYQRHCIAVPILKILEQMATEPTATMVHLILLFEYLIEGPKYSASFFALAGKLWRDETVDQDVKADVLALVSQYCACFTRESLYGVLERYFPEIIEMISDQTMFVPLRLHQFKPVEVLSLEPAFHEDGDEWSGNHKEMREAKKLQQQFKKDKRLTAKEMRKEARATEGFAAVQKQREKEKTDLARKRTAAKLQEAEESFRFTKTDNGKQQKFADRKKKKPRLGGNKM